MVIVLYTTSFQRTSSVASGPMLPTKSFPQGRKQLVARMGNDTLVAELTITYGHSFMAMFSKQRATKPTKPNMNVQT